MTLCLELFCTFVCSCLSWGFAPDSRWRWCVSPPGSRTAVWRRRPVAAIPGLQVVSWCCGGRQKNVTVKQCTNRTGLYLRPHGKTHLLSIRLSIHCLSLSSMSSCSVCSSTSLAPVLTNRQQAKLSTDWASTSVHDPASLQARRTHLRSPPSPRRSRWRCCGGWELQTPPRRRWCPSLPWTHF